MPTAPNHFTRHSLTKDYWERCPKCGEQIRPNRLFLPLIIAAVAFSLLVLVIVAS